jgi:hypothetical protein
LPVSGERAFQLVRRPLCLENLRNTEGQEWWWGVKEKKQYRWNSKTGNCK